MNGKHLPRVVPDENGRPLKVDLGKIVSTLIIAAFLTGAASIVTVAVLAWRADASEADVKEIKEDVERQGRNQMRLDESQRRTVQQVEHANLKLDALLEHLEVSERIPHPPLPPTSLEEEKP